MKEEISITKKYIEITIQYIILLIVFKKLIDL